MQLSSRGLASSIADLFPQGWFGFFLNLLGFRSWQKRAYFKIPATTQSKEEYGRLSSMAFERGYCIAALQPGDHVLKGAPDPREGHRRQNRGCVPAHLHLLLTSTVKNSDGCVLTESSGHQLRFKDHLITHFGGCLVFQSSFPNIGKRPTFFFFFAFFCEEVRISFYYLWHYPSKVSSSPCSSPT